MYDPVFMTLCPALFLHIFLDQELALHSYTSNSDILIMIATVIILTAQRISSLKSFCFFKLFFRLYFWLQQEFQQVVLGQGLQNNPPSTSQSDSVNMSHWSPLTVTAEMVAYPGHW